MLASSENDGISLLQLPGYEKYKKLKLWDSEKVVPGEILYHYGYALSSLIGNKGYYQGTARKYMFASTEMMH